MMWAWLSGMRLSNDKYGRASGRKWEWEKIEGMEEKREDKEEESKEKRREENY
jgi:hypothetical protein